MKTTKSKKAGWVAASFAIVALVGGGSLLKAHDDAILLSSAESGDTVKTKFALNVLVADVHYQDDLSLRRAAAFGHTETVRALLDAGADIHSIKSLGPSSKDLALRWAAENGHTDTVKVLLEAGADVHAYNDFSLQMSSYNGYTDTVKVLLEAGADVHTRDGWPLKWAIKNGHTDTAELLKSYIKPPAVQPAGLELAHVL